MSFQLSIDVSDELLLGGDFSVTERESARQRVARILRYQAERLEREDPSLKDGARVYLNGDAVGTIAFIQPRPCGCESEDCAHPYLGVPAGKRVAMYVGEICDGCADSHMEPYLVENERVSIDGAGSGSCDVCHGRLDYSWIVKFGDGKTSTRCSTHLDKQFDRAAVRR